MSGGGARGLVHIGAIKALEDRNYEVLGWAGTSIGAVLATLAAAGYRADELINADDKTTLLSTLTRLNPRVRAVTDLFGRVRWVAIRNLRRDVRHPGRALASVMGLILIMLALIIWSASKSVILAWGLSLLFALLSFTVIGMMLNGLGKPRWLKEIVRALLRERMFPDLPDHIVRMSDFGRDGRPTLKIVAANLTTGRLQLFSPDLTPDVDVADAVVASIALPVVFRLPRIRLFDGRFPATTATKGDLFADGGIVSNLPAWPFDEERAIDPHVPTIAFELLEGGSKAAPRRLTWPMAFLRTGLFGSGELNLRAANGLMHVPLSSEIGLLDFDIPPDQVFRAVKNARSATDHILDHFERSGGTEPLRFLAKNHEIHDFIRTVLLALRRVAPRGPGRIRVVTAVGSPDLHRSMRLKFDTNDVGTRAETDLIPIEGFVLENAYRTGQAQFLSEPLPHRLDLKSLTAARRQAIKARARWYLVVPVSDIQVNPNLMIVMATGTIALTQGRETQLLVEQIIDYIRKIYENSD